MLRVGIAVLLMFTLVSCVHTPLTRIAAEDFGTGSFTICGNSQARAADLKAKALYVCPGGPTPVRCAEQSYGSVGGGYAYQYGNSAVADAYSEKLFVGLIRSRGQSDYAIARCSTALSNSAGEAYPMAECMRCWL
jgi:hypothetical protein